MADQQRLKTGHHRDMVEIERRDTGFRGFVRVETLSLTHPLFAGGRSKALNREVLRVGQAVVALPWDPVRDTILLVEQFRIGALCAGAEDPWTLETVAGHIDAGETAAAAARREALEEAGVILTDLEPTGPFYSSPGTSDEVLHGFIGRADLSGAGGLHGMAGEGEDIRVLIVPFADAMAALERGEVDAGPLMVVLMALALRRDRLRDRWR